MKSTILCIGGPHAGEQISTNTTLPNYAYLYIAHHEKHFYLYSPESKDAEDAVVAMAYGYEQHCKAVAERNKPQEKSSSERYKDIQETLRPLLSEMPAAKDHYTASFLRSCRTVILASPFGEPTPLTLSYGKCYKGYLNEAMEFIVYAGMVNGEPEKSMGRIGTPICIVP